MDATLLMAWKALCQLLAPAFTGPTYVTFLHIATGWILCRSRPTVTNLVCTIGDALLGHVAKHWTTYERFFYRAVWSLDEVSRLLLVRVVAPLVEDHAVEQVVHLHGRRHGHRRGVEDRHQPVAEGLDDAAVVGRHRAAQRIHAMRHHRRGFGIAQRLEQCRAAAQVGE